MVKNRLFDNLPSNKKNKKFDIDIDNLCDPTPHKKTQSLKANYLLSSFLKREISEPTLV
jgi:hypothetical protein